MPLVQIAHNAVNARLVDAPREVKLLASTMLSYQIEGVEFTTAYQNGWDGVASFFSFNDGMFPAGFVALVNAGLSKEGYTVQIVRRPLPEPLGPVHPIVDDLGDDPRYDYQRLTVDALLRHGQMIAQLATGAGKSRVAKIATARLARPTMFLTTRKQLMYQMRESFQTLGMNVGVMGDSLWAPVKGVNVAMVQTLIARLALPSGDEPLYKQNEQIAIRERTIKLLEHFEFVILEEAHEAGSNSYYDILRHCRNANYRLSLTATPFMRADAEANMRLMGCSGPIGIQVSEKTLIDRQILAKPYFKFITNLPRPEKVFRTTSWQRAYKFGIVNAVERNRAILREVHTAVSYGLTAMVLVQRKDHGKMLEAALSKIGIRAEFIFGEDKQDARDRALKKLKNGQLDALIGSTILDVGVDVPAVGMIVLAGGGKAEVALRQRIGRGLREKKSGPNVCLVVDFDDAINDHLAEHAATRQGIIRATPGFAENILPPGHDFDYLSLGFAKRAA